MKGLAARLDQLDRSDRNYEHAMCLTITESTCRPILLALQSTKRAHNKYYCLFWSYHFPGLLRLVIYVI